MADGAPWEPQQVGPGFSFRGSKHKAKHISKHTAKHIFRGSYSWVRLVWPYTEELISRPFVGENRFRLVLQARMGPENAIGCIIFPPGATFFLPQTCTLLPLLSGHFKWICAETGHMDLFV